MPADERSPLLKRSSSKDNTEHTHVNDGLGQANSSRRAEDAGEQAVSKPEVNFIAVVRAFNDTTAFLHSACQPNYPPFIGMGAVNYTADHEHFLTVTMGTFRLYQWPLAYFWWLWMELLSYHPTLLSGVNSRSYRTQAGLLLAIC